MTQSSAAKSFCIAYRARFEPEARFRAYFTRCDSARFWLRIEQAYDKLVLNGDWNEPAFEWAVTQLLHRTLPVTSRNMAKLREVYVRHAAPVHSTASLVNVRERRAVRSLLADFNGIGQVEARA